MYMYVFCLTGDYMCMHTIRHSRSPQFYSITDVLLMYTASYSIRHSFYESF